MAPGSQSRSLAHSLNCFLGSLLCTGHLMCSGAPGSKFVYSFLWKEQLNETIQHPFHPLPPQGVQLTNQVVTYPFGEKPIIP